MLVQLTIICCQTCDRSLRTYKVCTRMPDFLHIIPYVFILRISQSFWLLNFWQAIARADGIATIRQAMTQGLASITLQQQGFILLQRLAADVIQTSSGGTTLAENTHVGNFPNGLGHTIRFDIAVSQLEVQFLI